MQKLALKLAPPPAEPASREHRAPLEETLRELVDEVREDARDAPDAYLAETLVPFGGE